MPCKRHILIAISILALLQTSVLFHKSGRLRASRFLFPREATGYLRGALWQWVNESPMHLRDCKLVHSLKLEAGRAADGAPGAVAVLGRRRGRRRGGEGPRRRLEGGALRRRRGVPQGRRPAGVREEGGERDWRHPRNPLKSSHQFLQVI
eukprot:gene15031-biopygen7055